MVGSVPVFEFPFMDFYQNGQLIKAKMIHVYIIAKFVPLSVDGSQLLYMSVDEY